MRWRRGQCRRSPGYSLTAGYLSIHLWHIYSRGGSCAHTPSESSAAIFIRDFNDGIIFDRHVPARIWLELQVELILLVAGGEHNSRRVVFILIILIMPTEKSWEFASTDVFALIIRDLR